MTSFRLISTAMLRKGLRDMPSSSLLLKVCNNLFADIKARESKAAKGMGPPVDSPLKSLVEDFIVKKGGNTNFRSGHCGNFTLFAFREIIVFVRRANR